jgi:hypothetical protein
MRHPPQIVFALGNVRGRPDRIVLSGVIFSNVRPLLASFTRSSWYR